jgi:hypothetical protein
MWAVYFLLTIALLASVLACLMTGGGVRENYTSSLQSDMAAQRYESAIARAHMKLYNRPVRPDSLAKFAGELSQKVSLSSGISTDTLVDMAKEIVQAR